MITLSRKLRVGLPILMAVAFITWATVAQSIVGGFASLGALVLIGMASLGIYALAKMVRYSHDNGLKHSTCGKPAGTGLITEVDKTLIMAHIYELFMKDTEQSDKRSAKKGPITKADKKLIMIHIDDLFVKNREQTEEKYA